MLCVVRFEQAMKKYKDYSALSTVEDGDIQYGAQVRLVETGQNVYLNRMIRFGPPVIVLGYILFYLYVGSRTSESSESILLYCICVLIFFSLGEYFNPGYLYGCNFLFDYTTKNGSLELVSVYDNPSYSDIQAMLVEYAEEWSRSVVDPEIADETGQKAIWVKKDGIVPWKSDGKVSRTITQTYSYDKAPNIVIFLVDDWGYNDVGYQSSYLSWTTPNIDRLAQTGIKFTNFFTSEWCVPSRAALLTGRYALRFGMHSAIDDASQSLIELPLVEVTLAEELKSAGYRTNLIGKWHVGWSTYSHTPFYRGFDYFYGFLGAKIDYWTKKSSNYINLMENIDLVSDENDLDENYHTTYLFEEKAEAAILDHVTNYKSQPLFLYYGSQLVHSNWAAPQSYIDRCTAELSQSMDDADVSASTYCAMNLLMDEAVGNLTCALDKHGLSDNTLIFFMSDNGGSLEAYGANLPYRGCKGSLLRGAESVPAFVYGPSSLIPDELRGTTYDGMIHITGIDELL